jgi:UDP:flavonoid glycosyltransferase YjiC (YdhE family)
MRTSFRHVLFLSRPDTEHLYLTLAVAEELGRRGHTVTFATSDPFADEDAESGVVLLRYGSDERSLRQRRPFLEQGPVDLVVADPRTHDAARELAEEWNARLIVAHTNLAANHTIAWPAERSYGSDYVYVHPSGRGTVFGEWTPTDSRPVLAVAHDDVPVRTLAAAFGEADWQVLLCTRVTPAVAPAGLPANITVAGPGFAALRHADVLLTDGGLAGIAAGLRHATPLVLAPRTPAELRNAARVAGLDLGTLLRPADLTPESLLRTVSRLAVDEAARAQARRVSGLLQAAGSPSRVSDLLESTTAASVQAA